MNEKLGKGNIDELMEERQVHKFLNIENSKKNYKKEWYKKNSEIVKERQAKYYADNADEINMKRRRKHNPIKRNDRYDPKKQKESYDPIKRKADHEKDKKEKQDGIFKESKAIWRDRIYPTYKARCDNVSRMSHAMSYVRECCMRLETQILNKEIHGKFTPPGLPSGNKNIYTYIDNLQNMSLPKKVIETMTKVYRNLLELYKTVEKEIKEIANEAIGIKLLKDLEKFYEEKDTIHWKKWENVLKVAESAVVKFSENIFVNNRTIV